MAAQNCQRWLLAFWLLFGLGIPSSLEENSAGTSACQAQAFVCVQACSICPSTGAWLHHGGEWPLSGILASSRHISHQLVHPSWKACTSRPYWWDVTFTAWLGFGDHCWVVGSTSIQWSCCHASCYCSLPARGIHDWDGARRTQKTTWPMCRVRGACPYARQRCQGPAWSCSLPWPDRLIIGSIMDISRWNANLFMARFVLLAGSATGPRNGCSNISVTADAMVPTDVLLNSSNFSNLWQHLLQSRFRRHYNTTTDCHDVLHLDLTVDLTIPFGSAEFTNSLWIGDVNGRHLDFLSPPINRCMTEFAWSWQRQLQHAGHTCSIADSDLEEFWLPAIRRPDDHDEQVLWAFVEWGMTELYTIQSALDCEDAK